MPRRLAGTGPDKSAGIYENVRIKFNGDAVLTGKNEMENPLLEEFTSTGELEGWLLDHPPVQVGVNIYRKAPTSKRFTRQASLEPQEAYFDATDPHVEGDSPPDANHDAAIAPYLLPPRLELVASASGVGYAAGWWAFSYAYGVGNPANGGLRTNCALPTVLHLENGEGALVPLPDSVPDGVTFVPLGMMGPFPDENSALNTTVIFEQAIAKTHPRLPATWPLTGPFLTGRQLSFTQNETFVGNTKKPPKHSKRKRPGKPGRKKKRKGRRR